MKRLLIRGAIALAAFVLLTAYPISRLGSWLVVEDPLQRADAIIVLGGTMYERPLEAVDLFNAGYAPRLYLIREMHDYGEAVLRQRGVPFMHLVDVQADTLIKLGVPRDAIGVLNPANSTADEANHVLELVTTQRFRRVIIVTSKQHTRRARLVMHRRLAPAGVQVIMRASRYDESDVDRWWENRSTLRFTLFESQRLFGYWIGIAD